MQNVNNTKIKAVTTHNAADSSVELYINLAQQNLQVNGRTVQSITLYADAECCGDLAVNWAAEEDSSYVHNTNMLMRDTSDTNNNTATMGEFYWENCFTDTLVQLLQQNGFSTDAAEDVCTSEWGMQDVGRASYDSNAIAEEMLAAYNIVFEDA